MTARAAATTSFYGFGVTKLRVTTRSGQPITGAMTPGQPITLVASLRRTSAKLFRAKLAIYLCPIEGAVKLPHMKVSQGRETRCGDRKFAYITHMEDRFSRTGLRGELKLQMKAPAVPNSCKQGRLGIEFVGYSVIFTAGIVEYFVPEDVSLAPAEMVTEWTAKLCSS